MTPGSQTGTNCFGRNFRFSFTFMLQQLDLYWSRLCNVRLLIPKLGYALWRACPLPAVCDPTPHFASRCCTPDFSQHCLLKELTNGNRRNAR